MNRKTKGVIIVLISIILIFSLPIYSKAFSFDSIFGDANSFLQQGSGGGGITQAELQPISNAISGILLTIAVAVTFISIAVMGVSFAIQTVEDKAKIKEAMVPWLIGVLISFGAYGIWEFVIGIFYGMNL